MLKQNESILMSPEQSFLPTSKESGSFFLLFLSMVALFYLNNIIAIKYFAVIALSMMAFTSRKKLIWIAIYFVIIDMVGGFFTEGTLSQAAVGLPILTLIPGVTIGFKDILLLALILNVHNKISLKKLNSDQLLIILLIIFASFVGMVIFGSSYKVLVAVVFRGYFILLLFYIIKKEFYIETLFKFMHLISYMIPFIIIDQIYTAITGSRILDRLLHLNLVVDINTITLESRASPYGYNTVFFSFIYGLIILSVPKGFTVKIARYGYGAYLVTISAISVLLSATRGDIGVFAIILLFSSPYLIIRFRNLAITIGIFLIMLNILGAFGLNWNYFYRNTITRIMTTISPALAGKEFSEIDTGGRDLELPAIIDDIKKSPFVGYGFSSDLSHVYNNNFGGINTIIQFGVFGFIMVLFSLLRWLSSLRRKIRNIPRQSIYFMVGNGVFAALIGMMLGYFTTFNYFTSYYKNDVLRLTIIMAMSAFVFNYYNDTKEYSL
jgi:hypothetical protein